MIITINDDLTSNVTTEDRLLECTLPSYNPETQQPFASREAVQAFAESTASNPNYFIKKLSKEEKDEVSRGFAVRDVRAARDAKLASDVDVVSPMRWNSFSDEQRDLWTQYRLDLLSVPDQAGFPWAVEWPVVPA
jgi:hypothetical protein